MAVSISTPQQAVIDIENYMREQGGQNRGWYVGVAADARDRLFVDHGVWENGDAWIYRNCGTDASARAVEQHFLAKGCDGGPGGGDHTTQFVYAYYKTAHTNP